MPRLTPADEPCDVVDCVLALPWFVCPDEVLADEETLEVRGRSIGPLLPLEPVLLPAPALLPVAFVELEPPVEVLAVWKAPGDDDVLPVLVPLPEPPPGACR